MACNTQSEQDNMEIGFTSQRLRAPCTHRIERDVHQSNIDAFDIRLAQSGCVKVTRQELQQAEVRSDEVVNMLLAF